MSLGTVTPILRIFDEAMAREFYVDFLGFKVDWEHRFDNKAVPYHSVVVFVVRQGNPKGIADWADLDRDDIAIITPNPKTSGNGKYSFLAAWGSVLAAGGCGRLDEGGLHSQTRHGECKCETHQNPTLHVDRTSKGVPTTGIAYGV